MRRVIVIAVFAVLLIAAMRSVALACPTCGEALGHQDASHNGVAKGFFWSILFMMSMPYLLLATFGGCMYWKVRRSRAAKATKTDPPPAEVSAAADSQTAVPSTESREPVEV